jgi:predicted metal-binding membrane protein
MSAFSRQTERSQVPFLVVMSGLIALAWLSLWLLGRSPYDRYVSHDHLAGGVGFLESPAVMSLFVGGWTLMVVAMMLPTTLPLISLFRGIVRRQERSLELVLLLLTGYIAVWVVFGLLVHLSDSRLHFVVDRSAWMTANSWIIASATLVGAGIYQFTDLKYRCLDKCRSPYSFIMSHWRGRNRFNESLALGIHHGVYCLGCCWTLMLLMFAVGLGNLAWMLLLGSIMAIEKNIPWGRKLVRPLGIVLITWGVSLAVLSLMNWH